VICHGADQAIDQVTEMIDATRRSDVKNSSSKRKRLQLRDRRLITGPRAA